jgi:hypothetical protein
MEDVGLIKYDAASLGNSTRSIETSENFQSRSVTSHKIGIRDHTAVKPSKVAYFSVSRLHETNFLCGLMMTFMNTVLKLLVL